MTAQAWDLPLFRGMNEQTDRRVLPNGALTRVENFTWSRDGQLLRRAGVTEQELDEVTGKDEQVADADIVRLAISEAGQRLIFTKQHVFVHSDNLDGTAYRDRSNQCILKERVKVAGGSTQDYFNGGCAYHTGKDLYCYVWEVIHYSAGAAREYAVYARIIDGTGVTVFGPEPLYSGFAQQLLPRVVRVASGFVVAVHPTANDVSARTFDVDDTDSGWSAAADLVTDGAGLSTLRFDLASDNDDETEDYYFLAYLRESGASYNARGQRFTFPTTAGSTSDGTSWAVASGASNQIAMHKKDNDLYWAWHDPSASELRLRRTDEDMTSGSQVAVATTITSVTSLGIGEGTSTYPACIAWETTATVRNKDVSWRLMDNSLTFEAVAETFYECRLETSPFRANGDTWLVLGYTDELETLQPFYALVGLETYESHVSGLERRAMQSKFAAATAPAATGTRLAVHVPVASEVATLPLAYVTRDQETTLRGLSVDGWQFEFGSELSNQVVQVGGVTYVGGGQVCMWDNDRLLELGFTNFPPLTTALQDLTNAGGSFAGSEVFFHKFIYEYEHPNGIAEQSAPSTGVETTPTAGNSIDWEIPQLRFTRRTDYEHAAASNRAAVRALASRTVDTGSVFFLQTPTAASQNSPEIDPEAASDSAAYVDVELDATLSDNERIYTTGGALPAFPPPPSHVLASWMDRLCGVDAEDPTRIWVTTPHDPSRGVYHHPALQIRCDEGGDITALAVQDGNLYIFKEDSLFRTFGEGPDNKGVGGWPVPQRISASVGAKDWRSVVVSPMGVFFASKVDGKMKFYMIPRGEANVRYIGSPVADEAETLTDVTSAVHIPRDDEIRWTATDGASAGGVFVYNYRTEGWGIHKYEYGVVQGALQSAALWDGRYTLATTTEVAREKQRAADGTSGFDDTTTGETDSFVEAYIETGEIQLSNLAGFDNVQRYFVSGKPLGNYQLEVKHWFEGAPPSATPDDEQSFNRLVDGDNRDGDDTIEVWPLEQLLTSLRMRMTLKVDDNTGETGKGGLALTSVTLEYERRGFSRNSDDGRTDTSTS